MQKAIDTETLWPGAILNFKLVSQALENDVTGPPLRVTVCFGFPSYGSTSSSPIFYNISRDVSSDIQIRYWRLD